MRLRKRHISLFIVCFWLLIANMGCFSFRMSQQQQRDELKKEGIQPRFIQWNVDGRAMHATQTGTIDTALVLFVHGSPGSSKDNIDFVSNPQLLQLAQLIAVDRPGLGYSDFGRAEPSFEEQAKCIAALLKQYPKQKKILVGHSLGGPMIARIAMDYPQLVDGLLMIAPSIAPELEPSTWYRKILNFPLIRWLVPTAFRVSNREILSAENELNKMLPKWKDIKVPCIVMQGDKDGFVPKENADFAKKMLINSPFVKLDIIEGGNHFILWSESDKVVRHIRDLMSYPTNF